MEPLQLPEFLANAPSHFNWGLETGILPFDTLNLKITEHLEFKPSQMPIQVHLFRSFLYMSSYTIHKPHYRLSKEDLNKAYEKIDALSDEEEKRAYLTVAKCNEAYMKFKHGEREVTLEKEIEDLVSNQTDNSKACIDSVRAFALSRLGIKKYDEAKHYFKDALKVQPENTQWLYGLARLIGRCERFKNTFEYTTEMEEERDLYIKILRIDPGHAHACVSLAVNFLLKKEEAVAVRHAYRARELQPQNPLILADVGRVLRKAGFPKAALPVLKEGCAIHKRANLFHEMGLVYRNMYDEQQRERKLALREKRGEKRHLIRPDKKLLKTAVSYFTIAVDTDSTFTMALFDRAHIHERLQLKDKAEEDFLRLLLLKNVPISDKVEFDIHYGLFLQRSRHDEDKALQYFKTGINDAVQYCTVYPVIREKPKPIFVGSVDKEVDRAIKTYRHLMQKKVDSQDRERQIEGLKGLAWLHQVLGEYDAARAKYEEYLNCDGKTNDAEARNLLVKSLIQLDDFEAARMQIQILQPLRPEPAQQCLIECILRQAEVSCTQQNGIQRAKEFFKEAIETGSMDGCKKLADILKKEVQGNVTTWEFRVDCAKILHCCEINDQKSTLLFTDVTNLMDLQDEHYGTLRKAHLTMEQIILMNESNDDTQDILTAASLVFIEARSLLDQAMFKFQQKHYPALRNSRCIFFHVQQEHSNVPKSREDVEAAILKNLNKYKWYDFDKDFPHLLEFLVKFQPAYPGNHDNWYLAFTQLNNIRKHADMIRYSQYHVPVILNGKTAKDVNPIPGAQVGNQVHGVEYELFTVRDLARKVSTEVEKIAAEFLKHL